MSGRLNNIEIEVSADKKFLIIKPPFIIINTSKIICIYTEEAKKDDKKDDKNDDKNDDKFYLVIEVDIAGNHFKHSIPFKIKEKATAVIKEIFSKIG